MSCLPRRIFVIDFLELLPDSSPRSHALRSKLNSLYLPFGSPVLSTRVEVEFLLSHLLSPSLRAKHHVRPLVRQP